MLSVFVLAMIVPVLLGWRTTPSGGSRTALNAAVHRGELAAIDEAFARGAISAEAHRVESAEILRRVLDDHAAPAASRGIPRAAAGLVLLVPVAAVAVYFQVGNPAAFAAGESTSAALERHLERAPSDARAWVMLARARAAEDRFEPAIEAYERALAASKRVAGDPQVWCELADALGMLQGGSLAGRPGEIVAHALQLDPAHPRALEMAGSAAVESGDYRQALAHWSRLLERLEPESPERAELEAAVTKLARLAGRITPPASPALRGVRATPAPSLPGRG